MQRISSQEAKTIADLTDKLGSRQLRTLLTGAGRSQRLLRPERLAAMQSGRARITAGEAERLALVKTNSNAIRNLTRKNEGKREHLRNRAIRDWLTTGKAKGVKYADQERDEKEAQLRAIRALRFLGVDPSEGTYYVRRRKLA